MTKLSRWPVSLFNLWSGVLWLMDCTAVEVGWKSNADWKHSRHTSQWDYRISYSTCPVTHSFPIEMKEGKLLINDALNTFYLRLYGVTHMVKDHSDSKRGNPLSPHRLLFPISSKGFLYASSHRQDNTYHSLCYTSCGALAGTRNSSTLTRINTWLIEIL